MTPIIYIVSCLLVLPTMCNIFGRVQKVLCMNVKKAYTNIKTVEIDRLIQ